MPESWLFTVSQLAKELQTTPSSMRKALKKLKIKPKTVKCGCSYYGKSVKEKLKKALETLCSAYNAKPGNIRSSNPSTLQQAD